MKLFAVIRTRGEAWTDSLGLEQQPEWDEHAAFMNGLQREGSIVIGGPLDGTPDVLLIFRANGSEEIQRLLQEDPWTKRDLLRITSIAPWTIRLGSLSEG